MNITDTLNAPGATEAINKKGILDKDDFLKLLMVELQHQDPTDPMDSDKILSQTSQLATMESAQNTQDALEKLSKAMKSDTNFSIISAIGRVADLGSDSIRLEGGSNAQFDIYFHDDVQAGNINIRDVNGNTVRTVGLEEQPGGTLTFEWDGTDNNGERLSEGSYYVDADFLTPQGQQLSTKVGVYPISSVKFDGGQALVRLGSDYVPVTDIKEVL